MLIQPIVLFSLAYYLIIFSYIEIYNDKNMAIRNITIREALCEAMSEEMRKDENVFLLGEEVAQYNGAYKVSQGMWKEFGDKRVIDTPITEYAFTGLAIGASYKGLRPIVEFMTFNFAMQAIDHIINTAGKGRYMSGGKLKCPIVFRGANGVSKAVGAQHSQSFAPWYSNVPGLIVIAPYTAQDMKGLLKSAIINDNPVVFLENELLYGEKMDIDDNCEEYIEIGKAKKVREGNDITILSYSYSMKATTEAVQRLADQGIEVDFIDLRTLRPLDTDMIFDSVKKTGRILIVEDCWKFSGIASEIIAQVNENCFDYLDCEPRRVSLEDVPLPYSPNLEKASLVKVEDILKNAIEMCNRK